MTQWGENTCVNEWHEKYFGWKTKCIKKVNGVCTINCNDVFFQLTNERSPNQNIFFNIKKKWWGHEDDPNKINFRPNFQSNANWLLNDIQIFH